MANHENAIDARATFITLMLREDHQNLKELFAQFGKSTNQNEKRNIVTAAIAALEVHTTLKEELIYPAWQEQVGEQELTNKALADHYIAHLLIEELKKMDSDDDDERYNAKFTVLSEHITRHIKEAEGKMFPQVEKADLDWDRLTTQVIERRQILEQKTLWLMGVPVTVNVRATVAATRGVLSCRPGPSLAGN